MANQNNIINDLSTLTKIPGKSLNEVFNREALCIGSAVHDALLENETCVVLNIGIGNLSINLADMQCKFMPSKELKTIIKRSLIEKIDPIEFLIDQAVVDKLVNLRDEVV